MTNFPFILLRPSNNQIEAIAAVRLVSLLKDEIAFDTHLKGKDDGSGSIALINKQTQNSREALLFSLAAWDFATTLEIRINVVPDLKYKAQGKIEICLLLLCQATIAEDAKEILISRFLSLMPLLAVHTPEAHWVPVTSEADIQGYLRPFNPVHAISVNRKREPLTISTSLNRNGIGFGKGGRVEDVGDAAIEHLYPWIPSHDDWSRILNTLTGQLDPVQVVIRLKPLTVTAGMVETLTQSIQQCEVFLGGQQDHLTHSRLVGFLRDNYLQQLANLKERSFSVGVFLIAPHHIDSSLAHVLGRAISSSRSNSNEPVFFKGSFAISDVPVEKVYQSNFFKDEDPFSLIEAACAFRFPSPPSQDIPGLATKRFRSSLADIPKFPEDCSDAIKLFMNMHQGQSQPVYIDTEARMRHCFILGQTGTGKTSLMESMILQDIKAGKGVAVIDPHGDMVDSLINRIPRERAKDVIVFDLLDREYPIGFNIFDWKTIEERDLIIDELYRTLDHIYDMKQTGGPIFESHFRNMMKLLLGDKHRPGYTPTILEFIKCYIDRKFRDWLLESVSDQQVKDFVEEAEDVSGDASLRNISPYVTSKFSRFVNDTTLKRIVGQSRSSIDFEKIMNDGKILFLKLGKGRFGSQVSALLANMIVARFKFSAMKRGEIPEAARRDFFLYVDEAHNLPQDNFTELLSEARKYRLGLILSTQYCSQLGDINGRNQGDLLSSILGNVGTTIMFRTGTTDAAYLAEGLSPYFKQQDIVNLPNFHGYARMNLTNEVMRPFSFCTELSDDHVDKELGEKILQFSRQRYGQVVKDIDAEIQKREKFWKEQH